MRASFQAMVFALTVFPLSGAATESAVNAASIDDDAALRRQVREEADRINALERRLAHDEVQRVNSAGAVSGSVAPNNLSGAFDANGFTLQSADGADAIHLRGNISVDGRHFGDTYTSATADTWLVRRLRPTLEGTFDGRFDFRIMPDFAQGKSIVQDAGLTPVSSPGS